MPQNKRIHSRIRQYFILLISLFGLQPVFAAGLLTPSNGSLPALEIISHKVDVTIEDAYAITRVEQVFNNPHNQDLEARYSFPVPAHASVAEFTLWINGKPVTAEVLEKGKARKIYQEEKKAGRDAGLTEKDGYKTFEIMVSPVRAGKTTRIRLVYIQPVNMDTGIGRYVYPLEEGGVDEQKLAFWTSNNKVKKQFNFNLKLKSSVPVDAVRVPGKSLARVQQKSAGEWQVLLGSQAATPAATTSTAHPLEGGNPAPAFNPQNNSAAYTLDKDLIIYWRQKTGLPGRVDLVTYKPDASKRGTFMMVVTPGMDLKPITKGMDWIFVLDISGSMQAKYATLADGVQRALKKMRASDRFRIVLFNSRATDLTSGYINATPDMIRHYSDKLAQVSPGSGTNLYAGLAKGMSHINADRTSAIVLVTDGVANVGETHQRKFIELLAKKDIRLFTFIMGNSANRPMLELLTRESGGFAVSLSSSDDIVGQILKATSKVTHQALHGADINISGIKTADISPRKPGSVYRGQQIVVFGHYWGSGQANVSVSGKISGQKKIYQTQFNFPSTTHENPEIERLWAYSTIEDLMDEINNFGEKADMKNAIISLGIEYGLVTDYTSMLVVREDVFATRNINRANKQRLKTEQAAQQQRQARPAPSRRADNNKPMFRLPQPHFGGGGAMSPWTILLLVGLLVVTLRHRRSD